MKICGSLSISEGQPQPDAYRSAAVNSLLWCANGITTEVRVREYVLRENDRLSLLVQTDQKIPEPADIRAQRRPQWMIEDVVEICPDLQSDLLRHGEVLMDAEIDPPGAGPGKGVALR